LQEELPAVTSGSEVELKLDGDDRELIGTIASVAPVPETTDGLFTVEIKPRADSSVRWVPGALVSVSFRSVFSAATVRIPNDALVERHGVTGVFIVGEPQSSARAVFRAVKVKKMLGKNVWVEGGLNAGERVIAEGAYFIEDGERVNPISLASAVAAHD
jgi:multidrug efflux pump subunit AcrA (membrane-fusion protein)